MHGTQVATQESNTKRIQALEQKVIEAEQKIKELEKKRKKT